MDRELLRNGSGYVDWTAYKAMQSVIKGENKMEFNRGEIFEYETVRSEIKKALIVSADFRAKSKYLSIIILSEDVKGENMVPIVCEGMMYADCGMVSFAANDRLSNFIRKATDAEMQQIDDGIIRCLGIEPKVVEVEKNVGIPTIPVERTFEMTVDGVHAESKLAIEAVEELATAKAEANVYKSLYEQLLARMLGQAV